MQVMESELGLFCVLRVINQNASSKKKKKKKKKHEQKLSQVGSLVQLKRIGAVSIFFLLPRFTWLFLVMGSEDGSLSFPRFLVRLSLAYLGSFLAAGTLGSWSSFADLLTQAGVFADSSCSGFAVGKCVSQNERMQLLYYVAMAAQNVFAIPSGMLYDYTGPKFTSMIGLGLAVLGVAGCFVALQIPSAELILWLCVPLLELGQNIASWGVFGFIFYYKQHVGLITGICNSSFLLSSLMMYIVVAIVARGVLLKFGILFLLATTLLSCLLTIVSVPSLHEYQLSYLRTFGQHPQPRRSFRIIFMQLFQVFGLRKWQTLAYFAASAGD